jgi:hypothetical protein
VRQAFSNYIQDQFAVESFEGESAPPEFLGWLDSDALFTAAVTPHDLFDYDAQRHTWRPRAIIYNGCCEKWNENTRIALGGAPLRPTNSTSESDMYSRFGGLPRVGEGMNGIGFPIVIDPRHLKSMRQRVANALGAPRFELAIARLCIERGQTRNSRLNGFVSQFDVIMNFLYLKHRGAYAWAVRDQETWKQQRMQRRNTDAEWALADDDFNSSFPRMSVMKHKTKDPFAKMKTYGCIYHRCLTATQRRDRCRLSQRILDGYRKSNFVDRWPGELLSTAATAG